MDLLPRHAHVIANIAIGPALVGVQTNLSDCLIVSNIINKIGARRGQAWPYITVVASLGIIRLIRGFAFARWKFAFAAFSTLEQLGTGYG
jgi:hypothetical protein